jgi:hypothetical protein
MYGIGWRKPLGGDDSVEIGHAFATTLSILRRTYQKSHAVRIIVLSAVATFQTINKY